MSENGNGNGNGKVKLTLDELAVTSEVIVEVESLRSDTTFSVHLKELDARTEKEYKRIYNANYRGKPKQSDFDKAVDYVFDAVFLQSNIDWNGQLQTLGYESEKEYFLKDVTGRRYLRAVMSDYFDQIWPGAYHAKN